MSRKVYKYQLPLQEELKIPMPMGAKVLHFANQNEIPTIWVEVDTDEQDRAKTFFIVGTGHDIPTGKTVVYIGSALFAGGNLVWHLYEEYHLL